jgi:hypothetical protein
MNAPFATPPAFRSRLHARIVRLKDRGVPLRHIHVAIVGATWREINDALYEAWWRRTVLLGRRNHAEGYGP